MKNSKLKEPKFILIKYLWFTNQNIFAIECHSKNLSELLKIQIVNRNLRISSAQQIQKALENDIITADVEPLKKQVEEKEQK